VTETTINDMMTAYAEDAVDFASRNFGMSLDYTPESIQQVEAIAERLRNARPKGFIGKIFRKGPTDEDVQVVCKMLGGYIGEVYRRSKGGEWAINEEYCAIGVILGKTWMFPPAKVHKRLANGTEDNLWSYFKVMSDQPWT
jgi:hypothetical protein